MKIGIFLLLSITQVFALVPLEGIVFGDISDVRQYDPLRGLFNDSIVFENKSVSVAQREKIELYKTLNDQALNLRNSCDQERFYTYQNVWNEALAKRSVVATLQYIGLDITTKAIVKYAKSFNIDDKEFDNLVNNLVGNNCSKNLSVFSHKLLKDNFKALYAADKVDFTFPNLDDSPYFTKNIIDYTNSRSFKRNEFNYAIKNFSALCSWGGDVDNYRLLAPYLTNPVLMSYVYNHMLRKKLEWDDKEKQAYLVKSSDTVQVACEDLICRRRNYAGFNKLFPRMVGSTELADDLKVLYCNHFNEQSYKTIGLSDQLKTMINNKEIAEGKIEPMNLVALITGVPDLFVGSENYQEIQNAFLKTIQFRWDEWANGKSEQLITELLYEESLFVDLSPGLNTLAARTGDFRLTFDFTLGELDRVLNESDKISATFNLVFPKSYLKWVRNKYIEYNNKSQFQKMEEVEKNFATYIQTQLVKKKKYYSTKLWNEKFKDIIASNLIKQLVKYRGRKFENFEKEKYQIPVKFRFGLFALRYIREKYKASLDSERLTLKKESPSYTK